MINQAHTASPMNPPTRGVLTESEVLLLGVVQGKRALRSLLLPPDSSELSGLLEQLWQAGLSEVWVMPATTLSRTCIGYLSHPFEKMDRLPLQMRSN
jgi:hypothetical protein